MSYTLQIFRPESGFYLNTNHTSDDKAELERLMKSSLFDGVKMRMVDENGDEVPVDYVPTSRKADMTVEDIGHILNVPVIRRRMDDGED